MRLTPAIQSRTWLAAACVLLALMSGCDGTQTMVAPDLGRDGATPHQEQSSADTGADAVTDAASRQTLRQSSIFKNGSFEQTVAGDPTAPASWACIYNGTGTPPAKPCIVKSQGLGSVDGKRYLELLPESGAFQDVTSFDQAKHVLFDLFARRKSGVHATDFNLYVIIGATTYDLSGKTVDASPTHPGWRQVRSLTHPLTGADKLRIVLYNTSKTDSLAVDDLIGLERETPLVANGHLLRAEHANRVSCMSGKATTIWVPLPLDHGVQVPLHVALKVSPSGSAKPPTYELDAEGNFGARVTFGQSSGSVDATISWTGVVLTWEAPKQRLGSLYPERTKASTWLGSTAVVNTTHSGLKAAALQAVQGAASAEQKLAAILGWTSAHIDPNNPFPASLDAVSAFTTKAGSCTAYANLAAAAGRVAGLPTRSVANYMVGLPQQTHSINEFYLGPQLGWRLVEPQNTVTTLPADYAVLVRINMPADEGKLALAGNNAWSAAGVPSRSLVHPVAGDLSRCVYGYPTPPPFPECPNCDNKAFYQGPLLGSASKVEGLFNRARKLWQATLVKLKGGAVDPAEQKRRAAALTVTDLAGLEQLIQSLEQTP